ncbi:putative phage-related protein [Nitratireductor basaltis]|uniref:Putative phage-related protein n=2 Tax=Nitratireductor basaltis TaxID=472175 RepID=A0A084UDK4_9HYPH|nr:putative phage-related protein [Nitratireductor basaltis]
MPAGRPTIFSQEVADEFCNRVIGGRSVQSVCEDEDMPASTTIYRWRQENAEFRDKLAQAREERLESYAARMIALGDRVINEDGFDPQRCNAAVNAIDKAARLQAPKQRIEMTGKDGGAIETKDISDRDLAKAVAALMAKGLKSGGD